MNLLTEIAKHLRQVYFGGNWTSVNMKDTLNGMTWQQATTKAHSFNTIATLVHHTGYYITAVTEVLKGNPLNAKDEYSFSHPPIANEDDWQKMKNNVFADVETFASLVEQLPEDKLDEPFTDDKYGSYYRNLQGIIEHTHYHLGQIVLIKKLVTEQL